MQVPRRTRTALPEAGPPGSDAGQRSGSFGQSRPRRRPVGPYRTNPGDTGLRFSEAIALRWADLDLGGDGRVRVRRAYAKGTLGPSKSRHGRRDVPLESELGRALREVKADRAPESDELVFPSERGRVPRRLQPAPAGAPPRSRGSRRLVGGVPRLPAHVRVDADRARGAMWFRCRAGSAITTRRSRSRCTRTCSTAGWASRSALPPRSRRETTWRQPAPPKCPVCDLRQLATATLRIWWFSRQIPQTEPTPPNRQFGFLLRRSQVRVLAGALRFSRARRHVPARVSNRLVVCGCPC
jgi:hypothetical protein